MVRHAQPENLKSLDVFEERRAKEASDFSGWTKPVHFVEANGSPEGRRGVERDSRALRLPQMRLGSSQQLHGNAGASPTRKYAHPSNVALVLVNDLARDCANHSTDIIHCDEYVHRLKPHTNGFGSEDRVQEGVARVAAAKLIKSRMQTIKNAIGVDQRRRAY